MNFRPGPPSGIFRMMKASVHIVVCLVVALVGGCVQAPLPASLERSVTPPLRGNQGEGGLVVFSAYDVVPFAASEIYTEAKYHSDYEVHGERGFTAKVRNRDRTVNALPTQVRLTPGRYQVVAKANGLGRVAVPIVIESDLITTLHLDGPPAVKGKSVAVEYDLIRIADGRVVGWSTRDGGSHSR